MRRPLFRSSAPIAMTVAKMIVPNNVIITDVPFCRSSAGTVRGRRRRVTTDRMRRPRADDCRRPSSSASKMIEQSQNDAGDPEAA
jgi:hypothetical protein